MDCLNNLLFKDLQIIGQSVEKEFIFCYHVKERRIICFDQHAADERIRYEWLLDNLQQNQLDLDSIKTQACHGAIRFGDKLRLEECEHLINSLLDCKVPFKCAHSRCGVSVLKNLDIILYNEKLKDK